MRKIELCKTMQNKAALPFSHNIFFEKLKKEKLYIDSSQLSSSYHVRIHKIMVNVATSKPKKVQY
ncbi:hypothetical protein RG963_02145 [Methanosarcina sp. Z-7115]|uniref:Mobile element protein n=1 Tax=Methanosarcina baikalica TaxID=3073890 RepID=A0ABU2CXZ9_9EURY|nr:hypothetical protein [Methanosarcina sp. Z-7115]MDR7664604.1 hypothetical protein [Methanosarcina sp. Z-7115]